MPDNTYDRFKQIMLIYYSVYSLRVLVKIITFICEITLSIYIMIIPMQLAYHNILSDQQTKIIQDIVDYIVVVIFTIHIYLYFDDSIQKMIKRPNSLPTYNLEILGKWNRVITIQLLYDLVTWCLSVYMAIPENNSLVQRYVQLIFILKVYKLYKFHKRTIFLLIGSVFYPIYKIFFTLIIVFIVITYLSSIFFALDQRVLQNYGPFEELAWQLNISTEPNLINAGLQVKILMANYWALGTASTAAYGDVSSYQPQQVIFNIFVLFFAGFLYGFYVNNVNSIPLQSRQQQQMIIKRFNQLQKHSKQLKQEGQIYSSDGIKNQLYLRIICSLEYKQKEKAAIKRVEQVVPNKYLEQINYEIYKKLLFYSNFSIGTNGFFKQINTAMKIANIIKVAVCGKHQNIYELQGISYTNLVYINEGSIKLQLPGQLNNIISIVKMEDQIFGTYNFITNSNYPSKAIALTYVSVFLIERQEYKKCLSMEEAKQFNNKFSRCLNFTEQSIQNQIYFNYKLLLQEKKNQLNFMCAQKKCKQIQKILKKKQIVSRKNYHRQSILSKKLSLLIKDKKKNVSIQTQNFQYQWSNKFQQIQEL